MRDFFGALSPSVLQDGMGKAGYATMVLAVVTVFAGLIAIIQLTKYWGRFVAGIVNLHNLSGSGLCIMLIFHFCNKRPWELLDFY